MGSSFLKQHYERLTTEELHRLRSTELTADARNVLEDELASRVSTLRASVGNEESGSPAHKDILKPKAAWLLQIFCLLLLISILVGLVRVFMFVAGEPASASVGSASAAVVWRVMVLIFLTYVIWGIQRQIRPGRLMGLSCIALLIAANLYRLFIATSTHSTWKLAYHDQQVGEGAEAVGNVLITFLMGYWFYAFGLSKKARQFFGGNA